MLLVLEQFPLICLREVAVLRKMTHPNIVPVLDLIIERGQRPNDQAERRPAALYVVFPLMDHDLMGLIMNPSIPNFSIAQIKCYAHQLLTGLAHLHHVPPLVFLWIPVINKM